MDLISYPLVFGIGSIALFNRYLYRKYFNKPRKRQIENLLKKTFYKRMEENGIKESFFLRKKSKLKFLEKKSLRLDIHKGCITQTDFVERVKGDDFFPLNFKKLKSKFDSLETEIIKERLELEDDDVEQLAKFYFQEFFSGKEQKNLFSFKKEKGGYLYLNFEENYSNRKNFLERFENDEICESELDDCFVFLFDKSEDGKLFFLEQNFDKKISKNIFSEILQNRVLLTESSKLSFGMEDLVDFSKNENFEIFGILKLEENFTFKNCTSVKSEKNPEVNSQKIILKFFLGKI